MPRKPRNSEVKHLSLDKKMDDPAWPYRPKILGDSATPPIGRRRALAAIGLGVLAGAFGVGLATQSGDGKATKESQYQLRGEVTLEQEVGDTFLSYIDLGKKDINLPVYAGQPPYYTEKLPKKQGQKLAPHELADSSNSVNVFEPYTFQLPSGSTVFVYPNPNAQTLNLNDLTQSNFSQNFLWYEVPSEYVSEVENNITTEPWNKAGYFGVGGSLHAAQIVTQEGDSVPPVETIT